MTSSSASAISGLAIQRTWTFIANTTGLDVVLGGHSHTYFDHPRYLKDKRGHEVLLDHQGKNARFLGTIEVGVGEPF